MQWTSEKACLAHGEFQQNAYFPEEIGRHISPEELVDADPEEDEDEDG